MAKKSINRRAATVHDKEIGSRLRALRIDKGMSQSALGGKLGVSFQQIQKYERGSNRLSVTRALEIAQALGTDVLTLMNVKNASKSEGLPFDMRAYKLAKAFSALPDAYKSKLLNLINTLISASK